MLSNKYLFGNVSLVTGLVISFTTIEWNLETSDSVADDSVCFEMLRRSYSIVSVM